ncbi:hypothetical protein M316_0091 [Nitrincola phage 1M3-16]|uniref:hypothetical protein n=1 Tax=Nitrincola phage 1M3-16 TaxID=1472912 RepID=UPI000444D6AC|nr:hypothetical protein GJ22_gp061 [Nitrincola phage 1M3-16]AHX01156.1 hypothetical protein M316_0091 [Nitrincola phage 1M3-16]
MTDLITDIPNDPALKKVLTNSSTEIVDAMIQIDGFKELVREIKETAKEKGLCPKFLASYAAIEYDLKYKEGKASETTLAKAELIETIKGN